MYNQTQHSAHSIVKMRKEWKKSVNNDGVFGALMADPS